MGWIRLKLMTEPLDVNAHNVPRFRLSQIVALSHAEQFARRNDAVRVAYQKIK